MAEDVYAAANALWTEGRYAEADALLRATLGGDPPDDRARSVLDQLAFMLGRAAVPDSIKDRIRLARSLANYRGAPVLQGADEGARLEQAADLLLPILDQIPERLRPAAARVLWQVGDYAAANRLGDFAALGRLAAAGQSDELLRQIPKAQTDADRLEILAMHLAWARAIEARVAGHAPPSRPAAPAPRERLRLGFLSSDLRNHVVAGYVQPLFEFRDPRFELYVYTSATGEADNVQQWFEARATFRRLPTDDREAAMMIAADDLDMLVDLGGPTSYSRPAVLAQKPARLQASWMGYPHSLGLAAIDYLVVDPRIMPTRSELMVETPLRLPATWVCMTPAAFGPEPAVSPAPVLRNGWVTFGTANDPYKFNPRLLRTWARVVAANPGSRFLILRPEAGAPRFRENIARAFAQEGVGAERLDFRPLRGGVRAGYADIDIALDTFPLVGGATTCDALWMGVPTVTLEGPALYERLGVSLMTSIGLPELIARDEDDFVGIATDLAAAPGRLAELRAGMRERIAKSPLGAPQPFAQAFYDLLAGAIAGS